MSLSLLYHWADILRQQFASLSKPQTFLLAAFSAAAAAAEHCQLRRLAEHLCCLGSPSTVERWLQRWLASAAWDVVSAQQELARWVIGRLCKGCKRLVLLVDETSLGEHLRVMAVCVAYRGRAVPVAWSCYHPEAYPEGGQVAWAVPRGLEVLVEADRGIGCSPGLLLGISALGWYYLVRVQSGVRLVLADGVEVCFGEQVSRGQYWSGWCYAFKKHGWLRCRAIGWWRANQEEGWLLLTNHWRVHGGWYARRMWEELAFRDWKSGCFQWQSSHVWEPPHAQRLWLGLAVGYFMMIWLGSWVVRRRGWMRGVGIVSRWSVFKRGLRVYHWSLGSGCGERLLLAYRVSLCL